MNKRINKLEKTTLSTYLAVAGWLARDFVKKYFDYDADYYWVAGEAAGTLVINDEYYVDMRDIADYMRHHYSKEMFFSYYHDRLKQKKGYFPNIKQYKEQSKRNP